MKKTIVTILASAATAAAVYGQGQINWAPSAANGGVVSYSLDNATSTGVPIGNPAQVPTYGALHVDFFYAPAGTVLALGGPVNTPLFTTAWTDVGVNLQQTKVGAGRMSATVALPVDNGQDQLEVVGWTGTATSWAAELASPGGTLLGFSGEAFAGGTAGPLGWTQALGDPNATPPGTPAALTVGAAGYGGANAAGLVLETVPEPTTLALGGLGVASLLLFRRRK